MDSLEQPHILLNQSDKELLVRLANLEVEVIQLKAENQSLRVEIQSLKAENARLIQENKELKDKLGLNSKTSGIPSSKELYKQKTESAKSGKKVGGQPGHKGSHRALVHPDQVISIPVQEQCECGSKLQKIARPYILQKVEIPPIKPVITEYQLDQARCRACKKYYRAPLPEGSTPDLLGPRAKAIISSLSGFFKNSKTQVQGILRDIFNLPLSLATICKTESRVSEKLKSSYHQLLIAQKGAKQLHMDETGHYQKKKRGWGWIFCNKNQSVIKLAYTRGGKFLERYLKNYQGIAISDRYAVYNRFENRQICWSHLARDFKRLSHSSYKKIRELGVPLVDISQEVFSIHKLFLKEELSEKRYKARIRKLRKRMWYYLNQCLKLPTQEGPQLQRIVRNIKNVEPHIWRFYTDPYQIPLTNNLAERQLRHYVVYRKTSYFTQSDTGDRFLERIISLYLTWRQQALNPFDQLLTLTSA